MVRGSPGVDARFTVESDSNESPKLCMRDAVMMLAALIIAFTLAWLIAWAR